MPLIDFIPEPTCDRFMQSDAFGRIVAGPVGSAKTTTCIMEVTRRAMEQPPGDDGIRHTRWAILRQTLKQLKDTVLKDIIEWIGPFGEWRVSESTFHLRFNDVHAEWIMIPLEDAQEQARVLSMQLTGAWLSECIEMDISILGPVSGRIGRFPSGPYGAPAWNGIIADTNMPAEMTPWHAFFLNLPPGWQKFIQPSGLAPNAENLNHLLQTAETRKLPLNHPARIAQGRTYYQRFVDMYGEDSDWVNRYVKAQYGDDPSGLAVFQKSFSAKFHCVDQTHLVPGYPLLVGQDFGRNPWSLICQPDPLGRLICHEEVKAENIGLEKHVQMGLRPILLKEEYLGYKVALIGDPAGIAKDSHTEENSFELLQRMGFVAVPAPTNDIDPRLRSVEALLARQTNGGPTLVINSTKCPTLARAMAGGYRFKRTKQGEIKAKPDKGPFSHVADCLQAVCLVVHGGRLNEIVALLVPRPRYHRAAPTVAGWT